MLDFPIETLDEDDEQDESTQQYLDRLLQVLEPAPIQLPISQVNRKTEKNSRLTGSLKDPLYHDWEYHVEDFTKKPKLPRSDYLAYFSSAQLKVADSFINWNNSMISQEENPPKKHKQSSLKYQKI